MLFFFDLIKLVTSREKSKNLYFVGFRPDQRPYLAVVSKVELSVYNLLGQNVATLVSEKQPAGFHQVEWDAIDFASGVYYYRLKSDAGFFQTKKLILLK